MGLFQKLKEFKDVDLALQVCNYYNGGIVHSAYQVQRLISKNNNSKKDSLLMAIKLCGEPNTPQKLYIVSKCYVLAGAEYRPQAIEFLLKYIDVGASWGGTPRDNIQMDNYVINQLQANQSDVYCDLGKCYEGEYQFEKALEWYFKALEKFPASTPPVCFIADVYVKMNNIDEGLKFLREMKNSGYKDMKLIANEKIKELREKKAKGYVYKPRPRKRGANSSQPL